MVIGPEEMPILVQGRRKRPQLKWDRPKTKNFDNHPIFKIHKYLVLLLFLLLFGIFKIYLVQAPQTKLNHIDGWLTPSSSQNVQVHHRIIPTSTHQCNICLNLILSFCGGATAYLVEVPQHIMCRPILLSNPTKVRLGWS